MRSQLNHRDWIFVGLFVAALAGGVFLIEPFVPALLWATVLAILTHPVYRRVTSRLEKGRFKGAAPSLAAFVAVMFTIVIVVVPLAVLGTALFFQTQGMATAAETPTDQNMIQSALAQVDQQLIKMGIKDFSAVKWFDENRSSLTAGLRAPAAAFAQRAGTAILMMVIAMLTQFFLLRDGYRLREMAIDLVPIPREKTEGLLTRLYDTVWAVFVGTVLVAMLQGFIIGVTYAAVGVPNAVILGVLSFVLSIVPLMGTPVIYIPVALSLFLQGNVQGAVIILVVGFGFVSQIDNVLRPFLIGGRTNLHPMVIFFAILGGVLLFGPVGVMAGPMLITILIVLTEVLRERLVIADQAELVDSPA